MSSNLGCLSKLGAVEATLEKADHQIAKPRDSSGTVSSSSVCPYIYAILQSGLFLGLSLKRGAVRTYTLLVNSLRNDYKQSLSRHVTCILQILCESQTMQAQDATVLWGQLLKSLIAMMDSDNPAAVVSLDPRHQPNKPPSERVR